MCLFTCRNAESGHHQQYSRAVPTNSQHNISGVTIRQNEEHGTHNKIIEICAFEMLLTSANHAVAYCADQGDKNNQQGILLTSAYVADKCCGAALTKAGIIRRYLALSNK